MKNIYKLILILIISFSANLSYAADVTVNVEQLKLEAASGKLNAKRALGDYYAEKNDIKQAEDWYRQAFYKEDGRSALALVKLHEDKKITLENPEKTKKLGLYYLTDSANNGAVASALFLGQIYARAQFVKKDYKKSDYWLLKAHNLGSASASYLLGKSYTNGLYKNIEPYRAFDYFKKASDGGISGATRQIAIAYETGIGADKNKAEARRYYERSARQGHVLAMRDYALFIRKYNKNTQKFIYWMEKASKAGDVDATYYLGDFYRKTNPQKAKKYFKQAADKKHYLSYMALKNKK